MNNLYTKEKYENKNVNEGRKTEKKEGDNEEEDNKSKERVL
jgi:hypothetical protein